jgi:hypothetical protein
LAKLVAACLAFSFLQTVSAQLPLTAVVADQVRVTDRARHSTIVAALAAGAQPFVFPVQQLIW